MGFIKKIRRRFQNILQRRWTSKKLERFSTLLSRFVYSYKVGGLKMKKIYHLYPLQSGILIHSLKKVRRKSSYISEFLEKTGKRNIHDHALHKILNNEIVRTLSRIILLKTTFTFFDRGNLLFDNWKSVSGMNYFWGRNFMEQSFCCEITSCSV